MCRHVAYWGEPVDLHDAVIDQPHGLLRQCVEAREMSWGCDNLDGWGFAWRDDEGNVHRYRTALAMTDDSDGLAALASTKSDRFVVHARQKTPGSLTDAVNSAPFWDGATTFFCHNGYVEGYRQGAEALLVDRLSDRRREGRQGDTDSEVLFAHVLDRLDAGASPLEALGAISEVGDELGGRFNVVLWCHDTLLATRWDNTLYVREDAAVTISSEPLDDRSGWRAVPERSVVIVDEQGARMQRW